MPNIGPLEIGAILVIVFLLFGATRLPKLGKSMGQSIRGFKTGLQEDAPDDDDEKPSKSDAAKLEKGDVTDKS
ncbi:MAG: twin-arginine translocase TatA/TatE family subunit [Actinobacteria bacterium]|nr:twin-arginine translocase TatA/TatE family subunit [Actinomycetota bacterium]